MPSGESPELRDEIRVVLTDDGGDSRVCAAITQRSVTPRTPVIIDAVSQSKAMRIPVLVVHLAALS